MIGFKELGVLGKELGLRVSRNSYYFMFAWGGDPRGVAVGMEGNEEVDVRQAK